MAKLFELPADQGICCIPLRYAVYCRACLAVSNSRPHVCSLRGSGKIMRLKEILNDDPEPPAKSLQPARLSMLRAVSQKIRQLTTRNQSSERCLCGRWEFA
jgi:ATP sulfurylase